MRTIKTTMATIATSTLMLSYAAVAKAHEGGPVFQEETTSSPVPYIIAGLIIGLIVVGAVLVVLRQKGGKKNTPALEGMVDDIKDGLENIENKLKNIEENIDKHINEEN